MSYGQIISQNALSLQCTDTFSFFNWLSQQFIFSLSLLVTMAIKTLPHCPIIRSTFWHCHGDERALMWSALMWTLTLDVRELWASAQGYWRMALWGLPLSQNDRVQQIQRLVVTSYIYFVKLTWVNISRSTFTFTWVQFLDALPTSERITADMS